MPEKKWIWTDTMDQLLTNSYDPRVKGRSEEIAGRLHIPRWAVNRRAAVLGLSRPKDRPWIAEEEAYLEASFHRVSVKAMARKLGRSPTAVKLKAKRLGLRKSGEGYTCLSLAQALGVDSHWVLARIKSGKMRASHRHTERTPQQGGGSWLITEEAFIAFLREHPYEIDVRKVDSLWFMDLIGPYLGQRTGCREAARSQQRKRATPAFFVCRKAGRTSFSRALNPSRMFNPFPANWPVDPGARRGGYRSSALFLGLCRWLLVWETVRKTSAGC